MKIKFWIRVLIYFIIMSPNLSRAQWVQTNTSYGGNVNAIVSSDTNLFAGIVGKGVILSTDNGTSWSEVDTGLTCSNVTSLSIKGKNIFAGTYSGGIFLSSNNGLTWTASDSGLAKVVALPDTLIPTKIGSANHAKTSIQSVSTHDTLVDVKFISSLKLCKNNLFAGTFGAGVYRFIDSGQYWIPVDSGLGQNNWIFSLTATDSTAFAATETGLYYTDNNGTNWNAINNGLIDGVFTHNITAVAVYGTIIFAGTDVRGVFRSTDYGLSWGEINNGLLNKVIHCLMVYNGNIFVGTNAGVFLSVDSGTTWNTIGLSTHGILCLAVIGADLFVGTTDSGILKRPLSELITSVEQVSSQVLTRFSLNQNFPNPFNPTTTISFNLLFKSFVSLKVYDALGREVSIILSEKLPAGQYSRQWNASCLSSGVYFYRLQVGSFIETKKLVLLH